MSMVVAGWLATTLVIAWVTVGARLLRLVVSPPGSIQGAVARQGLANFAVTGLGVSVLALADVAAPFPTDASGGELLLAVVVGCLAATPGTRFLASVMRRPIASTEWAVASMPMRYRVMTIVLVPPSEELLWRGILVTALVAIGIGYEVAVAVAAVISVGAHANVFRDGGLLIGTLPATVGTSVALVLGGLPAAIAVHVASDLEILVTPRRA